MEKPFAYKVGLKFTPQESKEIMDYFHENYFGNTVYENRKFEDSIKDIADDLGLTSKQVRAALSTSDRKVKKAFKKLERLHNKKSKLHYEAIHWVLTHDYPKIIRFLKLTSFWTWFLKQKRN